MTIPIGNRLWRAFGGEKLLIYQELEISGEMSRVEISAQEVKFLLFTLSEFEEFNLLSQGKFQPVYLW